MNAATWEVWVAFEIPTGSALSVSVDGSRALTSVGIRSSSPIEGGRRVGLAGGLTAGRFIERSVEISTENARTALSQSIFAGTSIREALVELAGIASVAAQRGLVSSEGFLINGTRVSAGNLQSQVDRAIGLIDKLVSASGIGSANFIDGQGLPISVQTSKFGGALTINPQGLDSRSLGISNLGLLTQAEAQLSEARLIDAVTTAGIRLERLTQLQSSLDQSTPFAQSFVTASASISGAVPVGALVNLSA